VRAICDFDDDCRSLHPKATIIQHEKSAWIDVPRRQIEPFGATPLFPAIGNRETIPPKTREDFTLSLADWLDAPALRERRWRDDPQIRQDLGGQVART